MSFFTKILDNYFNAFFDKKTIQIMCWDSETDGDINFCIKLQSYPPIGALINLETNSKLFKIESLEIQSYKGSFCIAKGIFID
ncbi:hypothetical protein [Flavobacterium degerlachei]|jgi:hypothetical protein|uniref:Uncharacterized protein n=1 Tax=Flavobacterium degerlachei TaxID=229203 RepID=A0A1H3GNF3_9FLAO|nr:hypothetical protein [Flavobacterium degerlachei]SDY04148.1 hypothetical protein SAMN05444338_12412 [Flavobacterium degerlachei]